MNRFDFSHLRGLVLILMRILLAVIFLKAGLNKWPVIDGDCLLYTSPSPRDKRQSRMPSSA